jgi:hypothetical protein
VTYEPEVLLVRKAAHPGGYEAYLDVAAAPDAPPLARCVVVRAADGGARSAPAGLAVPRSAARSSTRCKAAFRSSVTSATCAHSWSSTAAES